MLKLYQISNRKLFWSPAYIIGDILKLQEGEKVFKKLF